jgi:hypothetical protein
MSTFPTWVKQKGRASATWHIFPILVSYTEKNLATLIDRLNNKALFRITVSECERVGLRPKRQRARVRSYVRTTAHSAGRAT